MKISHGTELRIWSSYKVYSSRFRGQKYTPQTAKTSTDQHDNNTTIFTGKYRGLSKLRDTAAESGRSPEGETAESGLKAGIPSGFWLGFEGIVGMEEPVEGTAPPEEGKRGAISGDISVVEVVGNNAGAAVIVVSNLSLLEDRDSEDEAMKAIIVSDTAMNKPKKEAIYIQSDDVEVK